MKDLTIIMPFLNERDEPNNTIESIMDTANANMFNIIAIDDCSDKKIDLVTNDNIKLVRNGKREGVDASRQIGIDLSQTPYIFIIDAHMRFKKGWMITLLACLEREKNTIWCTRCLGLGYGNMDINSPNGYYNGATLLFINKDNNPDRPAREILEPKWLPKRDDIEFEIPCVLGANYGMTKQWVDYIQGFRGLKMWGTSEPFISLKSWLAGGKCKIRNDIDIGHKFRDNAPYSTEIYNMVYNKIWLCKTILPIELEEVLIKNMPKNAVFRKAMRHIAENEEIIKESKAYYNNIFQTSVYDYAKKFNISLPC